MNSRGASRLIHRHRVTIASAKRNAGWKEGKDEEDDDEKEEEGEEEEGEKIGEG